MSLMLSDDEDLLTEHTAGAKAAPADGTAEERKGLLNGDKDNNDDDFFLTGPKVNTSGLRDQVREVTEVMRENVARMVDRGDRLDDLQMRSEQLDAASTDFRSGSQRLRKRMWWQNTKGRLAIGGGIVGAIVIIIIIAATWKKRVIATNGDGRRKSFFSIQYIKYPEYL